jgi:hypothetical protein
LLAPLRQQAPGFSRHHPNSCIYCPSNLLAKKVIWNNIVNESIYLGASLLIPVSCYNEQNST